MTLSWTVSCPRGIGGRTVVHEPTGDDWPMSFWWDDIGGLRRTRDPLPGALECDVAIVGAGMTGLWTALELRRAAPELDVVLLEREAAGFGASGRNGGWVVGDLAGEPSAAMTAAIRASVDEVAAALVREEIECDLVKDGTLSVATDDVNAARLRAEQGPGTWLDAEELSSRVHVANARGALFDPACARVHPAKLVRGLAAAAERAGVRIFEGTDVTAIEPHRARTPAGDVTARWVVRATEGYTPGGTVVPVSSSMIVTERLPRGAWDEIGWAGAETMMSQAHLYCYLQRTADGRIAIGGRGTPYRWRGANAGDERPDDRTIAELRQRLEALFPSLRGLPTAAAWTGVLGVTRDWTPAVVADPATGLAHAGGYVGEGVAATNLAARTLRDLILGRDTDLTRLDWVGHTSRRWEPEPLRWLGIRMVYGLYRAADRAEQRSGKPARAAALADLIAGR
jgi:glycine/D-amino acid oxidase-like deaminating enzyme